jgi:hypothetical protein
MVTLSTVARYHSEPNCGHKQPLVRGPSDVSHDSPTFCHSIIGPNEALNTGCTPVTDLAMTALVDPT